MRCCSSASCSATLLAPSNSASVRASSGDKPSMRWNSSGSSGRDTYISRNPLRCEITPMRRPSSVWNSNRTPTPGSLTSWISAMVHHLLIIRLTSLLYLRGVDEEQRPEVENPRQRLELLLQDTK